MFLQKIMRHIHGFRTSVNKERLFPSVSLSSSFLTTCWLFCHKTWATMQFYLMSLFVQTCLLTFGIMTFSQNCDQILCYAHLIIISHALAGFLREDQSAVGSRLSGLPRRRAPMRWWRICSRGPGSMERCPWIAVVKGPESPARPV